VRAGGGVVWRDNGGVFEILLVHRGAQDDWTMPKGKPDRGESDEDCARREVEEETGLVCELQDEAGEVRYIDGYGRPKVARYWWMRPLHGEFAPDDEVDAVEWLALPDALARLTHAHDREFLANLRQ